MKWGYVPNTGNRLTKKVELPEPKGYHSETKEYLKHRRNTTVPNSYSYAEKDFIDKNFNDRKVSQVEKCELIRD